MRESQVDLINNYLFPKSKRVKYIFEVKCMVSVCMQVRSGTRISCANPDHSVFDIYLTQVGCCMNICAPVANWCMIYVLQFLTVMWVYVIQLLTVVWGICVPVVNCCMGICSPVANYCIYIYIYICAPVSNRCMGLCVQVVYCCMGIFEFQLLTAVWVSVLQLLI